MGNNNVGRNLYNVFNDFYPLDRNGNFHENIKIEHFNINLSKIEEEFKDLYKTLFEQNKQHSDNFKFIYKLVDDEIKKLNDTIENYDLISDHTGEGYINLKNDIKELEYLIKLFTIKNLDILIKKNQDHFLYKYIKDDLDLTDNENDIYENIKKEEYFYDCYCKKRCCIDQILENLHKIKNNHRNDIFSNIKKYIKKEEYNENNLNMIFYINLIRYELKKLILFVSIEEKIVKDSYLAYFNKMKRGGYTNLSYSNFLGYWNDNNLSFLNEQFNNEYNKLISIPEKLNNIIKSINNFYNHILENINDKLVIEIDNKNLVIKLGYYKIDQYENLKDKINEKIIRELENFNDVNLSLEYLEEGEERFNNVFFFKCNKFFKIKKDSTLMKILGWEPGNYDSIEVDQKNLCFSKYKLYLDELDKNFSVVKQSRINSIKSELNNIRIDLGFVLQNE